MAENSSIEWCDHTFNPFFGCTKVSPGCDNCYAEHLMDKRMHKVVWGSKDRVRTSPANWRKPIQWNANHAAFFAEHGRRQRVFCASLADVFDNAVDPTWRADLFDLIEKTPQLDWLLLTKRIGNVAPMIRETADVRLDPREPKLPANVWLGATIVNQEEADRDIPKLLAVPARVRFLSMEPLLGPVDLTRLDPKLFAASANSLTGRWKWEDGPTRTETAPIDWVIVGGESGHGARPMHPAWARSLRDQCAAAGVPFFFKQHGEWAPTTSANYAISAAENRHGNAPGVAMLDNGKVCFLDNGPSKPLESVDGTAFRRWEKTGEGDYQWLHRVGKRAAGRLLDGRMHDEFPVSE